MTTVSQAALKRRNVAGLDDLWLQASMRQGTPWGSWRYYLTLPLLDRMYEVLDGSRGQSPERSFLSQPLGLMRSWWENDFALPNYSRALATAARNENFRAMAVTSIALKRHSLRHGNHPGQLTALVPDYLAEVPLDWLSGRPLRYRLNADGTYLLYSVGMDGVDDDGVPTASMWSSGDSAKGDLVWPQAVPWE